MKTILVSSIFLLITPFLFGQEDKKQHVAKQDTINPKKGNIGKQLDVIKAKKIRLHSDTIGTDSVSSTSQNTITQNAKTTNNEHGESCHERNENVSFVAIVICAIFLPPVGVALMYGIHDYFWIDLILTLLFFFPGMIFALIVVLS